MRGGLAFDRTLATARGCRTYRLDYGSAGCSLTPYRDAFRASLADLDLVEG